MNKKREKGWEKEEYIKKNQQAGRAWSIIHKEQWSPLVLDVSFTHHLGELSVEIVLVDGVRGLVRVLEMELKHVDVPTEEAALGTPLATLFRRSALTAATATTPTSSSCSCSCSTTASTTTTSLATCPAATSTPTSCGWRPSRATSAHLRVHDTCCLVLAATWNTTSHTCTNVSPSLSFLSICILSLLSSILCFFFYFLSVCDNKP